MDVTPCQTLQKSVLLRRTELLGDLPYMTSLPTYYEPVMKPREEAISPEPMATSKRVCLELAEPPAPNFCSITGCGHRWDTCAVMSEVSEVHPAGLAELSADSLQLSEL